MRARLAAAAVGSAALLVGCGADDGYENALRPAAPIVVTAAIDDERVRVSPPEFGAGLVTFVISNTSGAPQVVTFETDELGGRQGGITRSTGVIAPRSTGQLRVDPREGTYRLGVETRSIRPARIEVSAARASAQDRLLQP
jgi:hypothetical protein